ncbi:MAG: flagellar biosynthetic protein FliO [Pseudomonadota bacterium]
MELADFSRMLLSLLAIIVLLGGLAYAAHKAGLRNGSFRLRSNGRLKVVETLTVDPRRKLTIVSCDGREHLILLGASGETVIETSMPAIAKEETPSTPKLADFSKIMAAQKTPQSEPAGAVNKQGTDAA